MAGLPTIDDVIEPASIIDDAPLRPEENRALRLMMEKERARQRWCARMRFWFGGGAIGLAGMAAAHEIGVFDWIAGVIVRLGNKH